MATRFRVLTLGDAMRQEELRHWVPEKLPHLSARALTQLIEALERELLSKGLVPWEAEGRERLLDGRIELPEDDLKAIQAVLREDKS